MSVAKNRVKESVTTCLRDMDACCHGLKTLYDF
jgi:hypothetical protein